MSARRIYTPTQKAGHLKIMSLKVMSPTLSEKYNTTTHDVLLKANMDFTSFFYLEDFSSLYS